MNIPRKSCLFCLISTIFALSCLFMVHTARSESAVYDVRSFGAKGDGVTYDTSSIQAALDACGKTGGVVRIPAGGTYLSKPLEIHAMTTLLIEHGAILQASKIQSDFMKRPGDWLKVKEKGGFIPFISGHDIRDVSFTGGGVIDGSGEVWWGEAEKARRIKPGYTLPRPNLIVIERCKNLKFDNITLQNSPKFHLVPSNCEEVMISNVTILAPEHAANTDAIDPSNCRNVTITRCRIDVGDDNVAIKAGGNVEGRDFASENINVNDCTFLHGHGMSIGSETSGGVRNVRVSNCTFENTENGIRIKSQKGRGGIVENITYDGITMKNVNPAITLTCFYQNNSSGDGSRQIAPMTPTADDALKASEDIPTYRHIRIKNLKATCSKEAGKILGLPESKISDLILENVDISAPNGVEIQNASGIELKNVSVVAQQGAPFILQNAQVSGLPSK